LSNNPIEPNHYLKWTITPFEFNYINQIPYPETRILEYLCRWRDKNGLEDLLKARQLLDMLIERVTGALELEAEIEADKAREIRLQDK